MTNKEAIKYLIVPIATSTGPSTEYLKLKEAYDLAIKALEERPHGKWIKATQRISDCETSTWWECSICKEPDRKDGKSNYCPNCGADMRKELENE